MSERLQASHSTAYTYFEGSLPEQPKQEPLRVSGTRFQLPDALSLADPTVSEPAGSRS